jgi:hypothetical protein
VLQQLAQQIDRVNWWCYGEAAILKYALNALPSPDYISHPGQKI